MLRGDVADVSNRLNWLILLRYLLIDETRRALRDARPEIRTVPMFHIREKRIKRGT